MDFSQDDLNSDDVLMTEEFSNNISEELKPTVTQITAHYQQKFLKDIKEMAKLISESGKSPVKEQLPNLSNVDLEKYKAITKIQNSVLFITNLIQKSE